MDAIGARVGLRAAGHHEEQVGAGQVYFIFLGCLILYSWDKWLSILGKHWVWPDGARRPARRFLNVAYANLVNNWTTNYLASRFNAGGADGRLKARVRAAVAKGPELLAKHSAGLDAGRKAELKAFIATLDLRKSALADSEWAIRMKLVEFRIAGEGFTTQGSPAANEARALGYAPTELPKLQQVADFYRQATGCTDAQAYVAALDPKNAARRLFAYGGRFATSVENFSAGLRLQREFKTWFADASARIEEKKTNRAEGGSVTVINANAEMDRNGTLTRESFFERFFPEVPDSAKMTNVEILVATTNVIHSAFRKDPGKIVTCSGLLNDCGLTATEAVAAARSGKVFPRAPYVAAGTVSITDFGTSGAARGQAVLDLLRPAAPTFGKNGDLAVSEAGRRFKAVFPDNTTLTSGSVEQANALAGKPNAQKAVSSLMHQGLAMHTMRLRIKMGLVPTERRPNPLASYAQPGAEKFVNRTGNPELFPVPTILENPTSRYELHLSDDGNTATVRLVWSGGINVGVELKPDLDTIGSVDVIEEITLDLTNDNPRITNVRLGQKISA